MLEQLDILEGAGDAAAGDGVAATLVMSVPWNMRRPPVGS